jgi:DNA-3-methyladenine glycosylase II
LGAVIASINLPRRVRPAQNYFQALCRSIIGQQLSVKAAATIHSRVQELFAGNQIPGPRAFLKLPLRRLRRAGLSRQKIKYMRSLAQFILRHQTEFSRLNRLADEEIITLLTQINGIGRWTAEMFLIFTLGREDVFSHGDLGLQNAIRKLYKLRQKPSLRKTMQLSQKWRPYRSIASLYLWASLNNS